MMNDMEHYSQVAERIKNAGYVGVGVGKIDGQIVLHNVSPEVEAEIRATVDLAYHEPVPQSIPLWRIMAAIEMLNPSLHAGVLQAVQGNVGLRNLFQFGGEIVRDSPSIAGLAAQFGLSASDVDNLFVAAQSLNV